MPQLGSPDIPAWMVDEALLLVALRTGVDFTSYRRPMVERRVRNHMIALGTMETEAYLDRLRTSPSCVDGLLERLTIKVTRFFRDKAVFQSVARALPILANERPGMPLRLWSAGCGTGEEAYTLGLLLEATGTAGTVLATDIDPSAIAHAQRASYDRSRCLDVPPEWQSFAFEDCHANRWTVRESVRARVRFGMHDLTSGRVVTEADDSHPTFDIICCRNVLIYLQREVQDRVLHFLTSQLRPGGWLVLGEAEWPANKDCALKPLQPSLRMFHRVASEEIAA
jgi:chemotaxis methyl-accepting protein methylase